MEFFSFNPTVFVLTLIGSFILGLFIRSRINAYRTKKLISELESFFGSALPRYKKNYRHGQVNWERVLKLLKSEPTTQQIANWRQRVKDEIKRESGRR